MKITNPDNHAIIRVLMRKLNLDEEAAIGVAIDIALLHILKINHPVPEETINIQNKLDLLDKYPGMDEAAEMLREIWE